MLGNFHKRFESGMEKIAESMISTVDKVDQKLTGGSSKPKRVDFNEFKKCWQDFNKNINKFYEQNHESPMVGGEEQDSPELGIPNPNKSSQPAPTKDEEYLTKHLKKPLQTIIYMIEIEERAKRKNKSAMGECVEYMLQENMLQVLCGLAKGDRPKGLLILVLKFVMYTMRNVRSTEILNYGQNHTSLHTLLTYIYISLQNEMLMLNKAEKVNLVDFLYHLTFRITYHCPELADLLLADQKVKSKKEKRNNYVPLQIALLLLIKEEKEDDEDFKNGLRKVLIMMLKQATLNSKIKDYILNESDLPILLVAKLAHYFGSLPDCLSLIRNPKVVSSYLDSRNDEQQYLSNLNLYQ